ncbi:hypothetical protein GCM10011390_29460 [Aureimonas endophytica]|uniref:DUF2939 family protein n=1 Tax=Aureimonas endophytica TaxID=2027858 RepID=A0A917E641_9HYPH|nr:DUF2939 domain-containing protein [Aureimonas endophytica]GGE08477.1 hypothetical protein GCM10011390_29460 [Aureimonas endophytica]
MRKFLLVAAVLGLVAIGYTAWPFVGLAQLAQAVRAGDVAEAASRIDATAVRRSLLRQILDDGTRGGAIDRKLGQLGRSLVVGLAQSALDQEFARVLDDAALRALIADGRLPAALEDALRREAPQGAPGEGSFSLPSLPNNPFRHIRDWRFRSPNTFVVTIGEDDRRENWTTLRLRLTRWTWRLNAVELPSALTARLRPIVEERLHQVGL